MKPPEAAITEFEMSIYKSVVHDGPQFEMERQIFLLAQAAAAVWRQYMEQEPRLKVGDDPLLIPMRALYQQLDKTDIFMGGYAAAIDLRSV